MTIMTRAKLDSTDMYALEFIKCVLSKRPDFSNNKKLISECYGLADELYKEWEKRFAEMEKEEVKNEKCRMVDSDGRTIIYS